MASALPSATHARPAESPTRRDVPSRVPPRPLGRRGIAPSLERRLFGAPLEPTPAEWRQLEEGLWQGDPAMDRVVDWIFAGSAPQRKALFERALRHGIDALADPPESLREFFALVDAPPAWLDREMLARGTRASALAGKAAFFTLRDLALMGGYSYFNAMNHTLEAAGALTRDPALRLGETSKWHVDVTEPGGLERFGAGFVSTLRVRMIHALVRRHLRARPDWPAARWGLPINQVDMLATYLAFGPVALLGARALGVPIRRDEAAAAMHLWRYVGFLSGVDERLLATTEGEGLRRLFHTSLTHPKPDATARRLGEALRNEPLQRPMSHLAHRPLWRSFQRRLAYHQHVSVASLILGPLRRRQLGLPLLAFPWYPLASAPVRFAVLSYYRLRGGEALARYLERSRERRRKLLRSYFDKREPDLLRADAGHPAHVG